MEHNQNPLTLEQLRQIDGQPVWVEDFLSPERSAWRLIYWDRGKYFVLIAKTEIAYLLDEYGKTWAAYACKPIDVDKWEPCELCIRFGETDPCYKDMCFKINAPNCGYACGKFLKWKPAQARLQDSKFCPECGRPLTQDARALLEKRIMEG